MSFIRPRSNRLADRSSGLRQELYGFLLSVTLWGALVGLLGNTAFAVVSGPVIKLAKWNLAAAIGVSFLAFAVLLYGFVVALANTITAAMDETRRFVLLLPLMYGEDDMDIQELDGYVAAARTRAHLRKAKTKEWKVSLKRAEKENPGRPFGGGVHHSISQAIGNTLVDTVRGWCRFYLSEDAEFHGVDYGGLAHPRGPCGVHAVKGTDHTSIHLPPGSSAELRVCDPDAFGRSARELRVKGRFGTLTLGFYPQWAVLGPYHQLSLQFAKSRLKTGISGYNDHDPKKRPSLWVIEVPVRIQLKFRNWRNPWFFLTGTFELTVAWLSDLLDSVEESLSWEWFVERESVRQTVREELLAQAEAGQIGQAGV